MKESKLMEKMKYIALALGLAMGFVASAQAADKSPNILFLVSDDTGFGDLGPYGGGIGRGMPIIFDSYDLTPVLLGTGPSPRKEWFYFTENELTPGAARVGNYKACFNIRGDNGQQTGGLSVDSNLGWKGAEKYVATVPQVFDLWADPQERYDLFMNNFTERTWTLVTIQASIKELMKTYVKYPPRKLQSAGYDGPITISSYQKFEWLRKSLAEDGVNIPLPTGN